MNSQKGITLTSLIIYVAVIIVVIGILNFLTSRYRTDVIEMRTDATEEAEYSKFMLSFLEEVKKTNNSVIETNGSKITFSTGTVFEWDSTDKSIYVQKNGQERFAISTNINKFDSMDIFKVDGEKIKVTTKVNGKKRETEYVLSNKVLNQEIENEELYYNDIT